MLSNMILQDTINGIRNVTNMEIIAALPDGTIAAGPENTGVRRADIEAFAASGAEMQEFDGKLYFRTTDETQTAYIVIVCAVGEAAATVGQLAVLQLGGLLTAYKEHLDKDNFIKNLLLDNLLLVDIYSRAKRLRISAAARRIVYIVESATGKDFELLDEIRNIFADSKTDFITAVDEKSTIIVKELAVTDGPSALVAIAGEILKAVRGAGYADVRIAYGNVVSEIKEVSRSYKEARMALDVGKIFFEENDIIAYSQLGIGRLIYQLPIPLCKMFIREIFTNKSLEEFDESTIMTINKFFENNLNVSETSRQLYIHRNTLVYRLDKLQKTTGLDLRVFEDAITFKIALMVVRYMKYMETLEY